MRTIDTPKIQEEDVEYICEHCKRGYHTERGLERHQQRYHDGKDR